VIATIFRRDIQVGILPSENADRSRLIGAVSPSENVLDVSREFTRDYACL
jgi:hypothetical protein